MDRAQVATAYSWQQVIEILVNGQTWGVIRVNGLFVSQLWLGINQQMKKDFKLAASLEIKCQVQI